MPTKQDLVADIVKELTKIQGSTTPLVDKDDIFPIPRMIATGDGRSIIVSKKIDQLITAIARRMKDDDLSLATTFTDADLNTSVRNAFGAALVQIDLEDEVNKNAKTVLTNVEVVLRRKVSSLGPCEYAFGCTLFSNDDVARFEIGPVCFETRVKWLDRKASSGAISKITQRRVKRAWHGQKPTKRKTSYDRIREQDILDTVGACPYVCSISTIGFAAEAGKEKALTAARLALAAIALRWETPSKALDGFNLSFDRNVRLQKLLTFVPNKIILAGSKLPHMPHGPYLKPGEWEKEFAANRNYFAVVGETLEYLLNSTSKAGRQKLSNTLAQSLLWFHEGCRETVTLMAIVKFSASMDALANGRKASGIRRVINARLGIKDEATIRPGGPRMKEVINHIYSEGRSRTIHGTNDKLGYDWTITRGLAEQFARLCLLSCIDWVGKNPSSDDPGLLAK